jgi:hypothetical protein
MLHHHHQHHRSQCRSTHHRFRVDMTNAAPPDTPCPGLVATIADPLAAPAAAPPVDSGVVSPLSWVSYTQPTIPVQFTTHAAALPTVQSVTDQSSIHVSIASTDADPQAMTAPISHGSPISLFPMDCDSISELGIPLQVPHAVTPLVDPIVQLLQGFRSMFVKQEQDHHTDRLARQRFKATMQGMMIS